MKYAAVILALFASTASADEKAPPCMDRNDFIAMSDHDYDQRQTLQAITRDGNLIEFYVAPDGEWTMIYVEPTPGPLVACYITEGHSFKAIIGGGDNDL